ncbi:ABC transporter permease [Azovibrio restrictus]|uniref:ABC transporter permease n=1 Tax=Azovibrio restrictus TaxID=146938 RepID=UPI0004121463|nr:ABC transporter permease [Azovibrio restrictus]
MESKQSELGRVWHYRRFIAGTVLREFKGKFNRSILGALWLLLAPFAMISIYTLVFSHVMNARFSGAAGPYSYSIFICAGLLPWQWFSELLSRNVGLFVDNAGLIKKNNFPRMALPVINFCASGVNFLLAVLVFLVFLLAVGQWPGWPMLLAIPLLLLQSAFASVLGFFLGVLNVFFRDVANAMALILQFWFWFTPIIYHADVLSPRVAGYLALNPLMPVFQGYQGIFLEQAVPDWSALLPLVAFVAVMLPLTFWFYRRVGAEIVDEL